MRAMKVHNPNNLPTIPIADLLPTQGNLKHLTEKNYQKLKSRIEHRGFSVPVYIWEDDKGVKHLLDGHQRRQVLITEGWNDPIPYLKIPAKDLQEAMARLLEITSQYATITQEGIDEFIATYELNEAEVYEATSFDALTSYGETEEPEVEEDEAPEVDESEPPKSKLGEIYQLGRHRVMCGDSTSKDVDRLFDTATIAFTSPPYNVGHNLGYDNDNKYNEYKDDNPEYLDLLNEFNSLALAKCKYSFVNLQLLAGNKRQVIQWLFENNDLFCDVAFWKKSQVAPAMARNVMNSQVECIFIFGGNGSRAIATGDFKGTVSNFLETNSASGENENAEIHSATYPISFVSHFIKNFTKKSDSVYDAFIGTGTTLIACEQTDRTCYGIEIDPKYVDVIRKRYAKFINNGELPDNWEELTPAINSVEKA